MNDVNVSQKKSNSSNTIRLAARVTGGIWLALGAIILFFAVGEGIQSSQRHPSNPTDLYGIFVLGSFILGLGGIALAYWKEGLGGLISLIAILIAGALMIIDPKLDFSIVFFIIAIVPSVLFIISWWEKRKSSISTT